MSTVIFDLFPQRVIVHDCDMFHAHQSKLINYCYEVKSQEQAFSYTMVRQGWQSPNIACREDFIPFLPFFNWNIEKCMSKYGFNVKEVKYELQFVVINIGYPGGYHRSHVHPKCDISGVLWLKSSENCGDIVFENNDIYSQTAIVENLSYEMRESTRILPGCNFQPVEGRMLLFPPNLSHHVLINESMDDRLSIVFNIRFLY